jgi:thiamine biosynthesis lipoprotein
VVRPWALADFTAMGNSCRVIAESDELCRAGEAHVRRLEHLWSRFLDDSEVSAVNRHAGSVCMVSEDTFRLIELAEQARQATDGLFNPLQLARLEDLGYRRSWHDSDPQPAPDLAAGAAPASTEPIELLAELCAVRIPAGTRFDPGGLGKGLAGDIVAEQLIAAGATTVQVELGGDVRVAGPPWGGQVWTVHAECADRTIVMSIDGGGAATSGVIKRSWQHSGRRLHHIIDPRSGWPAHTDVVAATVSAASLAWAEVFAKVAVIVGSVEARRRVRDAGLTAVLFLGDAEDGDVRTWEVAA